MTADPTRTGSSPYFPNLDALRFFAAFAVFIGHMEQFLQMRGFSDGWYLHGIAVIGTLGVTFFFVLSGFLITYLLVAERERTGRIDVLAFYGRRILRIWPLYYLLILLGLLVLPHVPGIRAWPWDPALTEGFGRLLLLFVVLLPNLAMSLFPPVPFIAHTWSIGVEEQFYLVWPHLIRSHRNPLVPLLGVVGIYGAIMAYLGIFAPRTGLTKGVFEFLVHTRIDCMAMGGIAAYVLMTAPRWVRPIEGPVVRITIVVLVAAMDLGSFGLRMFTEETYAALFAVLLLNLTAGRSTVPGLEWAPLRYLGRISYGVYMYHPLALGICLAVLPLEALFARGTWAGRSVFFLAGLGLTILLSALSYRFLETPFLRLKGRIGGIAPSRTAGP